MKNNYIQKHIIIIFAVTIIVAVLVVFVGSATFYNGFTMESTTNTVDNAVWLFYDSLGEISFQKCMDTPELYQVVKEDLNILCRSFKFKYMYLYSIDPQTAVRTYYIVVAGDENENKKIQELFPKGTQTENARQTEIDVFLGITEESFENVRNQYGNVYTWHYPVKDGSGSIVALLSVDYDMNYIDGQVYWNIFRMVVTVSLTLLLTLTILLVILNRQVFSPVKQLSMRMVNFTPDNGFRASEIKSVGELHEICVSFENMSDELQNYIGNIKLMTAENERISAELDFAAKIQADALPSVFPAFPDRNDFDIFALMDPAKEVGGDFYDFFFIDGDHLAIVIADVSDKGIPAALFMMASKILINDHTLMGGTPAEILDKVNKQVCANNEENMFVTVLLGIIELSTGKLTVANAGHEYPAVSVNGRFELHEDDPCMAIGIFEDANYHNYELTLNKGDSFFVYTDGAPEAANADKKLFGTESLLNTLNSEPDAAPEKILKNVRSAVDDFVKDAPQFDDLTMLCFKYYGSE